MKGQPLGQKIGVLPWKKHRHVIHISLEREEVHLFEVSGQILMVWTREKNYLVFPLPFTFYEVRIEHFAILVTLGVCT